MSRADITPQIIGAAIKIHRKLGPGLLESAYEACLGYELEQIGFRVQKQKAVPLIYESVRLDCGFRADLVVNNSVVVEIKCKEALHPVDQSQLISYLRLLDLHLGLLINFHVALLKSGESSTTMRNRRNTILQLPLTIFTAKFFTAKIAKESAKNAKARRQTLAGMSKRVWPSLAVGWRSGLRHCPWRERQWHFQRAHTITHAIPYSHPQRDRTNRHN
jgi:GxxExxY protein